MNDFLKLQNGSDVRGVALKGVEGEPITLTKEIVSEIATSFARWIAEKQELSLSTLTIGVGTDSRLSAEALRRAVIEGILATGANAVDCGLASTPAMFMSTQFEETQFNGAIMITASHLPWNRNGMKFFTDKGGLGKADITAILAQAGRIPTETIETHKNATQYDLIPRYAAHLRQIIIDTLSSGKAPLTGLKIGVDAGNGAGGFFARQVLAPLGADVSASQFLSPDGNFPNHVPNPENQAAMDAAVQMVRAHSCDLGLVFDTDVDRAAAVDETGSVLSRNRLIALLSATLAEAHHGATIVTDSVTSDHLTLFLHGLGLRHHRFKRGYRNVINECVRLNRAGVASPLAVETSGHCAYADNYFLDDGAYLATQIVIELVRCRKKGICLGELIAALREPLEAEEHRLPIEAKDFQSFGKQVLSDLLIYAANQPGWVVAPENYEGVRISIPAHQGWFLLRMSLHDPLMPLNIESDLPDGVRKILDELSPFLQKSGW